MVYFIEKDAKMVRLSDLKNKEDLFYFFWLFGIPVIVEIIIIGLPLSYGLEGKTRTGSGWYYLLFLMLFVIEFAFASWIYGVDSSIVKVLISLILFFAFFWKKLFNLKRS